MKAIFPDVTKDKIESLEDSITSLTKHKEIKRTFSDWSSIGVWNVSDILTFLLTSRITMYLAGCIENDDIEGVEQVDKYLLYFINYLLLTNIYSPSEHHGDHLPFHPPDASFPKTYEEGQDKMRTIIAEHFARKIWLDINLKSEFEERLEDKILSI